MTVPQEKKNKTAEMKREWVSEETNQLKNQVTKRKTSLCK